MSTKATIILTGDNDHWYIELCANYHWGMDTPDDEAVVLEFGPDCKIEDFGSEGFAVAMPSDNTLARIIRRASKALDQAELAESKLVNEIEQGAQQ